jgi:3-oxoacyl-[acyl-carrier protein] reductase
VALDWQGRIDVLVNNAGGGSSQTASATTLAEEDVASWDALVDANVKTAFLCTRAVAEAMKRARYGRIVNVSSRAARVNDAVVPQWSSKRASATRGSWRCASWPARLRRR